MSAGRLARLVKLYEDDLRVRFAARTAVEYLAHVNAFLRWLEERGLGLVELRSDDVRAYQGVLLAARKDDGKPYSAGFQCNRLKAIKSFCRFLARRGHLLTDPAAGVEFPRVEKRLPRTILSVEEVRRIVEAPSRRHPRGLRDRAILESFYATGIRASELCSLLPGDVDTEQRVLRVVHGKGGRERHVPLTRAAAASIEAYLARGRAELALPSCRQLFVGNAGGRMNRGMLSALVRHWTAEAGVGKRVTCHTFRHTVATHLLRGRADIRHIQVLLGHATLGTTELYTRVALSDLREVLRRAHPRGR